jgi:hypothetical protein
MIDILKLESWITVSHAFCCAATYAALANTAIPQVSVCVCVFLYVSFHACVYIQTCIHTRMCADICVHMDTEAYMTVQAY